ncbi:MAG: acyltransferase family protein [Selenomonadaceae bacterium]|nr:acetyltransferase [Selenomonadaceae bacterium]MDY3915557.1 acyltransferase family protein [Selenomonadaceae bacterium]
MERIYTGGRRGSGHIEGLDALRALAIIGVTFFHMFPETVRGGYLGVSLFFVLTGFLLAYTGERSREAGRFRLTQYFWHRIRRIYPPLILVLLVSTGVFVLLEPKVVSAVRPEALSILFGYNNWWQIAQNADYFTRLTNASPFTHMWFMGVELQYYVIWPVLFFVFSFISAILGRRMGLGFIAVLAIGSAVLMPMMFVPDQDVTRLYYGTDTRIYALLFGAFLGLYKAGGRSSSVRWQHSGTVTAMKYVLFALALVLLLLAGWQLDGQDALTYEGGMLAMTLDICLLLWLTADESLILGSLGENGLMRWLGRRSYSIYLWQYPVIFLFQKRQWTELSWYPALELAVIILLAIWTDMLTDWLLKREFPAFGRQLVAVQCICFLLLSLPGIAMAGYGCKGIVESAEVKASDTGELQANLAANKADLASQNAAAQQTAAQNQPEQEQADKMQAQPQGVSLHGVAFIGDSVMLGSAKALREVMPDCYIDAEVSRYVGDGLAAAQNLADHNMLGKVVVLGLGTNGPISGPRYEPGTKKLIDYLGPDREIYWINVYGPNLSWQDANNAYIAKLAAEHPNIHVIDWYSLISQHKDWLVSDGIHPDTPGTHAYAQLIVDTLSGKVQ